MCAAFMKKYDGEKYSGSNRYFLYDLAYKIFDYLALKTKIAENLVPAYRRGDKETLRLICDVYFPDLEFTRFRKENHCGTRSKQSCMEKKQ